MLRIAGTLKQMSTQIPEPLQAAFQKAIEKKTTKKRKDSEYTSEERDVLGKYKEEYKNRTTTDERESLFQNHILVDMFTHWFHKGEISEDMEEEVGNRIKVSFKYKNMHASDPS